MSSCRWTLLSFKPKFLFLYKTCHHSLFLRTEDGKTPSTKDSIDLLNMISGKDAGCLVLSFSCCLGFSWFRDNKLLCFTTPPSLQDFLSLYLTTLYFICWDANYVVWLQMRPCLVNYFRCFVCLIYFLVTLIYFLGCLFSFLLPGVQSTNDAKEQWGLLEVCCGVLDIFLHACNALTARGVGGKAGSQLAKYLLCPQGRKTMKLI